MRTITSQNRTFIQSLGKCKITGHIQQIALLLPETGLFYVKETTGWAIYTSQISVRSLIQNIDDRNR